MKEATTSAISMPDGIILFAHGSRDPLWRGPIEAVAHRIRADHPEQTVACAYLELCAPSLPDAAATMMTDLNAINSIAPHADSTGANGSKRLKIRIVPMFLGMGKHAREDLPELVSALRLAHPQVDFDMTQTVGEDSRVTALLAQIAIEAVA